MLLILEKEEKTERNIDERETSVIWLPPIVAPTRDPTQNPDMCALIRIEPVIF